LIHIDGASYLKTTLQFNVFNPCSLM